MEKLKVLVVEDHPASRLLLLKKLKKQGYDVRTAGSGVEAAGLISQYYFDVILTDLIMPGDVDGIGVLEKAKARNTHTEVILITAHATVETAVEAMKKRAADYLQKPINVDELMLRLERISTMKSAIKDADDLREAMDLTEKTAASTIHNLEMMISDLRQMCSAIKKTLTDQNLDANERVSLALEVLPHDP